MRIFKWLSAKQSFQYRLSKRWETLYAQLVILRDGTFLRDCFGSVFAETSFIKTQNIIAMNEVTESAMRNRAGNKSKATLPIGITHQLGVRPLPGLGAASPSHLGQHVKLFVKHDNG